VKSKILRVEIEYDNETISLTGEDAVKWLEYIQSSCGIAYAHGMYGPVLNWNTTKKETQNEPK